MIARVTWWYLSLALLTASWSLAAEHPANVAVGAVRELYLKPLGVTDVALRLETEPFGVDCSPDSLTVVVVGPTERDRAVRLRVVFFIIGSRIQFLSASGPLLDREAPVDAVDQAIEFFVRVNGWSLAEKRHRGRKPGRSEVEMWDASSPPEYMSGERTLVFQDSTNLPVMVGAPHRPSGFCDRAPN